MNDKMSRFKSFLENFWYYHKFKVLVAVLILIVLANTLSQIKQNAPPDYAADIVTEEAVGNLGDRLSAALNALLPDKNADGRTVTEVNVYQYARTAQTPFLFSESDSVHLAAELQSGAVKLFIADSEAPLSESGLKVIGSWEDFPLLMAVDAKYRDYIVYAAGDIDSALLYALLSE